MTSFTPKYSGTLSLAGFIAILGWLIFIGGFVLLVAMLSGSSRGGFGSVGALGAILTGGGVMLSGLLQVLIARMAIAAADAANNSAHLLVLQLRRDTQPPTAASTAQPGSSSFGLPVGAPQRR